MDLVEEVNPLIWLPITENFADAQKYAGEQNIAHIVNVALKYPLQKEQSEMIDGMNLKKSSRKRTAKKD